MMKNSDDWLKHSKVGSKAHSTTETHSTEVVMELHTQLPLVQVSETLNQSYFLSTLPKWVGTARGINEQCTLKRLGNVYQTYTE